MLTVSLTVVIALYLLLLVLDIWLMRRYARLHDEPEAEAEEMPEPALGY
jgi:cytochrome bd-type quinol oxidase subunit 1